MELIDADLNGYNAVNKSGWLPAVFPVLTLKS